jgi:hypothetical protein
MANSSSFNETILIPGPSFQVDLAPLDSRHPVHYGHRLLIFRCSSLTQRDAQLAAFKISVSNLLSRCPMLGGTVMPAPSEVSNKSEEGCCTIVPGPGIEFIVRDLRTAMPSFGELEAAHFATTYFPYDLFVPIPRDIGNDAPFAACKIQFSAIEGGTIITWAISHAVADGSGNNEMIRVLAEETRLAQKYLREGGTHTPAPNPGAIAMGSDRTVLRNMKSDIEFNIEDHPAFRLPKTSSEAKRSKEQAQAHPFEARSPEVPVYLHISTDKLSQLKEDAKIPGGGLTSSHDAICALLWRTVILIRSRRTPLAVPPASIKSDIFMPSDARRHLNLPVSYVGNAVYQLTASLDLETLFSPSGLQEAAKVIRQAILSVKPELVASYFKELKERWIDWGFMENYSTTGFAMGSLWTSGMLYRDDWGEAFGPLVRCRYSAESINSVMPKLPDGSAELVVSVMPEEVEFLKGAEGFGRYLGSRE